MPTCPVYMSAEIQEIVTVVEESLPVQPGEMRELETPGGRIQVIGTERGFVIRNPEARIGGDIRYEDGETLTIRYKDGTVKIVTAKKPEDWTASDILDPML